MAMVKKNDSITNPDPNIMEGGLVSKPNIDRGFGYVYNSVEIFLCFTFIISCGISYRGCAKSLSQLSKIFSLRAPHYTTIRAWVLKIGYFKLMQPKEYRTDWVFIIDLTITIGIKKCMVILGAPLSKLRANGFALTLQDVEVLHMSVCMHSNHKTVKEALITTSQAVGLPVEVISDFGPDVKKGIDEFCCENKAVHFVYDVTHMAAVKLKRFMEKDEFWPEISRNIEKTKHQTRQSVLSHLSPPCQRNKSRYLNLEGIIKWADKMKLYRQQVGMKQIENDLKEYGQRDPSSKRRKLYSSSEAALKSIEMYEDKFGWLAQCEQSFQEYRQYIQIIGRTKREVAHNGLSKEGVQNIELAYSKVALSNNAKIFKEELLSEIKSYIPVCAKNNEAFLGCSDIIESLFGKYKYLNNEGAMMGITQSALTIPAIASELDIGQMKKAMEFSKVKDIEDWSIVSIGESVFSKRKKLMKLI